MKINLHTIKTSQVGYSIGGDSDEGVPFWCAYGVDRSFNEADSYEVQLSFGTNMSDVWENCDKVVVYIENEDDSYTLEDLDADEFFTAEYGVRISYTYRYFKEGDKTYEEVDKATFDFSYTNTYDVPNEIFNEDFGVSYFKIVAYSQDSIVGISFQPLFYVKGGGEITILTSSEYYELR